MPASADDIVAMQELVRAAMAEGAVGLSAGLTYTPGMYADNAELLALCAIVGELGGFFAPHHRSYGKGALDAYAEMIDLATRAGCPLHLSHATMNFAPNKGRAGELLAMLDAAIADGVDITLDTYPYLPGATTLSALLPSWSSAGGRTRRWPGCATPRRSPGSATTSRSTARDGCHGVVAEWDTIEISGVRHAELDGVVGRTIAADRRRHRARAVRGVRRRAPARRAGHRDPAARRARGERAGDHAAPAAHGRERRPAGRRQAAPARLGHLPALPRPLLPRPGRALARGVRRAPHRARRRAPAAARPRPGPRPGYAADLVLFDPATVADAATYDDPRQPAVGIPYVFVNGELAMDDGKRTAALAGRALTPPPGRSRRMTPTPSPEP